MLSTLTKKVLATSALALAVTGTGLGIGAKAASADSLYFNANGQFALSMDVSCDSGTHKMNAGVTIAPEPGFANGQYAVYRMVIKDATTGQRQSFNWQGPFWVKNTTFVNNGITYVYLGSAVPGFTITGVAGHLYYVGMDVEWWNPNTRAYEGLSTVFDTSVDQWYWMNGIRFHTTTQLCHT